MEEGESKLGRTTGWRVSPSSPGNYRSNTAIGTITFIVTVLDHLNLTISADAVK
jgi:hypothetical protein